MDDIGDLLRATVPARRDLCSRLQRRLQAAVRDFMQEETGLEPYLAMEIANDDDTDTFPHNFSFSFRYPNAALGIKMNVTVVDDAD